MIILKVSETFIKKKFKEYPWLYEKWGQPQRRVTLEEAEYAMDLHEGNMTKASNYLGASRS